MKSKDISITRKICLSKSEVKWLTTGWQLLTFDDSSKLSILEHMLDTYQKKAEHPWISCVATFLCCSWPYDLSWPWFGLEWPFLTSRIVCITIATIIGLLHIKWKLKTGALNMAWLVQGQMTDLRLTSLTSNDLKL